MITQKIAMFIAAWDYTSYLIVFAEPSQLASEVDNISRHANGCSLVDLEFGIANPVPPSDGLWMFVGTRSSVMPGDPWKYSGAWRRPTDAEAIAASCGENPCLEACGT